MILQRKMKIVVCSVCGNQTGQVVAIDDYETMHRVCEMCVTFTEVEDEIYESESEGEPLHGQCCAEPCFHVYGVIDSDDRDDVQIGGWWVEDYTVYYENDWIEQRNALCENEDGHIVDVIPESECCNCGAIYSVRGI